MSVLSMFRKIGKADASRTREDLLGTVAAIARSQAVIEFSLDGKILTANDNFLRTLGYGLADFQGQHHSLFVEQATRASSEYRMFWDKLGRG